MNKTLIALAAALMAAATMFSAAAEAGFKVHIGFGFPIGGFNTHSGDYSSHRRWRERHYVQRKAKSQVAKKSSSGSKTDDVAKTEDAKPADAVAAETENSSITTAAIAAPEDEAKDATKPAETTAQAEPKPAADTVVDAAKTAKKLDCKKFFPSVGMTLTVPCE